MIREKRNKSLITLSIVLISFKNIFTSHLNNLPLTFIFLDTAQFVTAHIIILPTKKLQPVFNTQWRCLCVLKVPGKIFALMPSEP